MLPACLKRPSPVVAESWSSYRATAARPGSSTDFRPRFPSKSAYVVEKSQAKKRKFLRFMREAVRRRLSVEASELLTPLPLSFPLEISSSCLPAFCDGELESNGQPSASQPRPPASPGSKFELQRDAETFTAG